MKLFDRITLAEVDEYQLPEKIDLGRFCLSESNSDLTYSNFNTNNYIKQEIFSEENEYLQKLFEQFNDDIEKGSLSHFDGAPIVQRVTEPFNLTDFEKLLWENLFHIEEIFRSPSYHLEKKEEKIYASRAKRITLKSYEYLACHTEDWLQKSIISFKPNKILTEEYELFYDIYENKLAVAFIDKVLIYLKSRTKQLQDLGEFHNYYIKLLEKDFSKGWYHKLYREFELMGSAYQDEYYSRKKGEEDAKKLIVTEEILRNLYTRILSLKSSFLYNVIDKRSVNNLKLIDTDLLINHKHYKYLRLLWFHFVKIKPNETIEDKIIKEQKILDGVRNYVKILFIYLLKNTLKYKLTGTFTEFVGEHKVLEKIIFKEKTQKYFELVIGKRKINIVVLASKPEYSNELIKELIKNNVYILHLYFGENSFQKHPRLIPVNPRDPYSLERVGLLIRSYLSLHYLNRIKYKFDFKPILKEFILNHIKLNWINFDVEHFYYELISKPDELLNLDQITRTLQNDPIFKKKNKSFQMTILDEMIKLTNEINEIPNIVELFCFNCYQNIPLNYVSNFDYINCPNCNFIFDTSKNDRIIFQHQSAKNKELEYSEFGMDYFDININLL